MRRLVTIALGLVAFAGGLGAAVALAQGGASVNATGGNTFSPGSVTITAGQSVTWDNTGGTHNVHFSGEAPLNAQSGPGAPNWPVSKPFPAAGTFTYLCDFHGASMSGTVVVNPASGTTTGTTTTPTTPTTPTGTTPTPPPDTTDPGLTLRRRTVSLRRIVVRFRLNEDATVTARLRRRGSTRTLKRVTKNVEAGNGSVTITRRLRARARYSISLRIVDAAGNVTTRTISFRAPRS